MIHTYAKRATPLVPRSSDSDSDGRVNVGIDDAHRSEIARRYRDFPARSPFLLRRIMTAAVRSSTGHAKHERFYIVPPWRISAAAYIRAVERDGTA